MALIWGYRHHEDPWPFIILGFLAFIFVLFWFLKFGAFVRKVLDKPEMDDIWHRKNFAYALLGAFIIWLFIFILYWACMGKPML